MYKWVPMFDIKSVFQSYIVKKAFDHVDGGAFFLGLS